jgi:nonsense-mediated mRNA decay protein 3
VERYTQCPDCKKKFTPHDWNTVIQVRQHIPHKKTFHTLEQNLLKQKWSDKVLKIE